MAAMSQRQAALKHGWRSGLEGKVGKSLQDRGVTFTYESLVIEWVPSSKPRKYTPDFIITTKSGKQIIVETKGRWLKDDRLKMKAVCEQHPHLDIRMVFQRPNATITKTSRTTYAQYAERLGMQWAQDDVPDAWIQE